MASAYRGEAKTDARGAYVIAETLRHRGDLQEVEVATSLVTELLLLVTHRTDMVGDRVRMVNRLRDVFLGTSRRWNGRSTTPIAAARWSC